MAKKSGWKILGFTMAGILCVIVLIYTGVSIFFMGHFQFNTTINGIDFSVKSVSDVESYMKSQVDGYELKLQEKNNSQDIVKGSDISLVYKKNEDIENARKAQNPFAWPAAFFSKESAEVTINVSYDEAALDELVANLKCIRAEQVAPISATPKFDGEKYVIEPEVIGTEVDKDMLNTKIHEYIAGFKPEFNMEAEKCYKLPQYTSESEKVVKAVETLNHYCKASITYDMKPEVEVVDKLLISGWLSWDPGMKVTFNPEAVTAYMKEFGKRHNTVGATRTIVTPSGKSAEVSGGTYGWSVDEAGEAQALIASIQKGEVVTREPLYAQTAATHEMADWGTTYAEVDLSAQHMWFVSEGAVALETDVVTGETIPEKITPSGVYSILEKELNKTLVGEIKPQTGKPAYETLVSFWMRVTWSGIGFHDADWQTAFGGSLNQIPDIGSHGCINMPVEQAARLYELLPMGTPVIVHY
ncbi:MAG: L,D-transpeptidase family protein [Lachnospiraceae bacterium]